LPKSNPKNQKKSKKVKPEVEEEDSGISDEVPKKVKKSKKDKAKNDESPKKKKKRKLEEPEDEEISNKKAKTEDSAEEEDKSEEEAPEPEMPFKEEWEQISEKTRAKLQARGVVQLFPVQAKHTKHVTKVKILLSNLELVLGKHLLLESQSLKNYNQIKSLQRNVVVFHAL